MADDTRPIGTLLEKAEDYSKTSIELLRLNAIDKSAEVLSSFVSSLTISVVIALSLIIVNIGLALWIGKLLGNDFYGFFAIGGFYLVLALLLYLFRERWIKFPISNSVIRQLLRQKLP